MKASHLFVDEVREEWRLAEDLDANISWSIYLFMGCFVGLPIVLALAWVRPVPPPLAFPAAALFMVVGGAIFNRLRPRYAESTGRWRTVQGS